VVTVNGTVVAKVTSETLETALGLSATEKMGAE
jgi:hypothetical protein